MELRSHVQLLKNARWFILIFTVLVGCAALVFAVARPVPYTGVVSFELSFVNRPPSADYQYGAYYELKGAELYTQHLMSLMMTPAVVEDVYTTAGVPYTINSLSQFTNRFRAKQYSDQNFSITFTEYNKETAEKLATAITQVIQEQAKFSGRINDQEVFGVQPEQPVITKTETNLAMAVVVGLIGGLLLSIILVYIREYFRR